MTRATVRILAEGRDAHGRLQWLRLLAESDEVAATEQLTVRASPQGTLVEGPLAALVAAGERHEWLGAALAGLERGVFTVPGRVAAALELGPAKPRVMGIVNLTPDSFSDGGRHASRDAAIESALAMERDGATILDLGGESTRPGARAISSTEELERVLPVLEGLRPKTDAVISIDTSKADVARAALDAGADWINDVTGLTADPDMAAVVSEARAGVVIMHMRGTPRSMQDSPSYADCFAEVRDEILTRVELARNHGIDDEQILIDPGIGFAKRLEHNLELLRELPTLRTLGFPILLGVSRKSFLGRLIGRTGDVPPAAERDAATVAALCFAATSGVSVHRVHNVRYATQALRILGGIQARKLDDREV